MIPIPSPRSAVNLRSVEEASALQRRLYRAMRETMRAMAGKICDVPTWEVKQFLSRQVWIDAEHADSVRTRVLELRYPRVDVDDACDRALVRVLEQLPAIESETAFLAGVFRVVKPRILDAVRRYLAAVDELADAPSVRSLQGIRAELETQTAGFEAVWASLPAGEREEAGEWTSWMGAALAEAGGIWGTDTAATSLPPHPVFGRGGRYVVPLLPRRDPRWLPAVTQVPPRPPRTPEEQQVWIAIDHANELWACEAPAAMIWHYDGLPWALYHGAARWQYDEMRHCMMGFRRLERWGFRVGVDVPMVPDHWVGVAAQGGMESMLFVVHGLEQGGPKWKAELASSLWKMGDRASAQDCDYDWADESGHIRYGMEWIRAVFPTMTKAEVVERTRSEVEQWKAWIADKHRTGAHGYERFLPRIESKCAEMPRLERAGAFKPMGSSAATLSYAR